MKLKEHTLTVFILLISTTLFAQQNGDDLIKSGNRKDSLKNFSGAIADFTAALSQDPENVNALYYRGYVYYELKKYPDAITDFNAAINIDTLDVESFFNRGNARFELKDYRGAIKDFASALALDPNDKECYYNKAIAEYNIGSSDDACRDLELAVKYGDAMALEVINEICR